MAPEIDINRLSESQREAYSQWRLEKGKQGVVKRARQISSASTETVKVTMVEGEPMVEYASDLLTARVHKVFFGEKIAQELESLGLPVEKELTVGHRG